MSYLPKTHKQGLCRVPGCTNPTVVSVALLIRETTRPQKTLESRTIAVCDDHAKVVAQSFLELFGE
jgi:hypothetical protein